MTKANILHERYSVCTALICPEILMYTYNDFSNGPIGFVWGIGHGQNSGGLRVFDVSGSYVLPCARRNGVRTAINEYMFRTFDVVRSTVGTEEGGRAFMEASGYQISKETGEWYLTKAMHDAARESKKAAV